MKAVCVIPARGGSIRIPRKNIAMFHGRPMLHYALATAWNCRLFDRIVVSTDDNEIAALTRKFAKEKTDIQVFRRMPDDGKRGTQEVAREVLRQRQFKDAAVACVLYPCTPLLGWDHLLVGYRALLTVDNTKMHFYSLSITPPNAEGKSDDAGGFYFGWASAFLAQAPLNHQTSIGVEMSDHFDINTPDDWARAEQVYGEKVLQFGTKAKEAA